MDPAEIVSLPRAALTERLRAGHPVDPAWLADVEYHGTSIGVPEWFRRLTWTRFYKVFEREPRSGAIRGWNVAARQDAPPGEWRMRLRRGRPIDYGWFRVVQPDRERVPRGYDRGLLIHYGRSGNRRLDPLNRVRDPLVALVPGDPRWLLGVSYVEVGPALVHTPTWFLLERGGPLSHRAAPPRGWPAF